MTNMVSMENDESVLIECQELSKSFQNAKAVDGVSLTVSRGEILVIIGYSGCGKTTLLRLLAGFEVPDEGVVRLGGHVVAGEGVWIPPEARRVGMVFQDYSLFPHMTVAKNIEFGLKGLDKRAKAQRVQELLELVHMEGFAERGPHQLSGGEQQRVALVRSLASYPVALLLDEPFSNLDTRLRYQLRSEVRGIVQRLGVTTVFVTHDQQEALFLGDQIAVMNEGKLEQVGTPEDVFLRPSTRFVARFIGGADFLSATVTENGLASEVGFLDGSVDQPIGARVAVAVRADQVSIQPSDEGMGRIEGRVFRGLNYMYLLSLPSGATLHTIQHPSLFLAPGDLVDVSIETAGRLNCFSLDSGGETVGTGLW